MIFYLVCVLTMGYLHDEDTKILRDYAIKHKLVVAMANFSEDTGGWKATGKSAIWNSNGDLLAKATENVDSIVVGTRENNIWKTKIISYQEM